MFGLWAAFLLRQSTLETPSDFIDALTSGFPDTSFEILSHKREFTNWMGKMRIGFSGMGGSTGAAHSFTFMRREDCDTDRYGQIKSSFTEPAHRQDVVMMPRKYMASTELCQSPQVALPHERLQLFLNAGHGNPTIAPRLQYSKDQIDRLEVTATKSVSATV